MPRLPLELMIPVVNALHDGLYFPDEPTRRTLVSLCLTSRFLNEIAVPPLYSCIRVILPDACEQLARSNHVPKHLTSISVSDPTEWGPQFLDNIPVLCSLLTHARTTLRTVILDMPLRAVWPEDDTQDVKQLLRHALDGIPNIETLVSCRDELFLRNNHEVETFIHREGHWIGMSHLRRMSLYNPFIDEQFAAACLSLSRLETLVFYNADFDSPELGSVTTLLQSRSHNVNPLVVILIFDCLEGRHTADYYRTAGALSKRQPNLHVIRTESENGRAMDGQVDWKYSWIRVRAETGKLWHLRG